MRASVKLKTMPQPDFNCCEWMEVKTKLCHKEWCNPVWGSDAERGHCGMLEKIFSFFLGLQLFNAKLS